MKFRRMLLDLLMPVMDGFEVLASMNRSHMLENLPVIMISSEDSDAFIRRAYEQGVSDYISRPFDAKVVYRRVYNTIKLYAGEAASPGVNGHEPNPRKRKEQHAAD